MRRFSLLGLTIAVPCLLGSCTGTGLFFDHTFQWFGHNPNGPAGASQTMQRIRGEQVTIAPILPEAGNVWPGPQPPDPTMDQLSRQQAEAAQRGGSPITPATGATVPRPSGLPSQPSIDVGGGSARGYRQLQPSGPAGKSILVPNGNGTSTLINPDGSIQTVPTPK